MSILLVSGLSLGTFCLILLGRPRASLAGAGLALVWTWFAGSGVPAKFMLDRLQNTTRLERGAWGARNAIVLLGWDIVTWPDGPVRTGVLGSSRVVETARQYFACRTHAKVCRVVVSGGDPLGHGRPEAEAMGELLEQLGVPKADLILEARSNNTFKNAQYSSAVIGDENLDDVTLVTSGFHLTRSRLYFAHFLGLPTTSAPADHLEVRRSVVPQTSNFQLLDIALTEVAGLWRFRVYNLLGWNPPGLARAAR